ncbi:hypothetical protein [Pseudovibrio ascidiaceicola]|nr:hypothetical protein [Pseudovibrio ascidiaceicola]
MAAEIAAHLSTSLSHVEQLSPQKAIDYFYEAQRIKQEAFVTSQR